MFTLKLRSLLVFILAVIGALPIGAQIAQDPLLSRTAAIPPNVVIMVDDSGSMPKSAIYQYGGQAGGYGMSGPGASGTDLTTNSYATKSPDVNLMYYDPRVTYSTRVNADGTFQAAGSTSGISSFNVYFYKPAATNSYSVDSISLTDGGDGYPLTGVTATFPTSPGTNATATVTVTASKSVGSVSVNNEGSGYNKNGNVDVTFSAPPVGGIQATGTIKIKKNKVKSVNIDNPGSGYLTAPTITLNNSGSGATFTVNMVNVSPVSAITLTSAGSGYTTQPALTLNNTGAGAGVRYIVTYTNNSSGSAVNRKWDGAGTPTTSSSYFTSSYTPDAGSPLAAGASSIAYPNTASSSTSTYPKFRGRTDCGTSSSTSCTWAQELQNYANWKAYHSTRLKLAQTGIGLALQPLNPTFRLGWGTINTLETDQQLDSGVRLYDSDTQSRFLTWLYGIDAPGNTPNRIALNEVGKYFQRSDANGPWADTPPLAVPVDTTSSSAEVTTHATCRRSYALLVTDGYYNDSFTLADVDSSTATSITQPSTYQYTAIGPYSDTTGSTKYANSMADVAMKYWVTDLRPNLKNNVKPVTGDEAYWQHLNFYAVGLGIDGTLDYADPAILQSLTGKTTTTPPRTMSWPVPKTNDPKAIDDMWHATVNGRGKMLSARNATELNTAVLQMMSDISGKEGTQSGVAVSTASLTQTTKKYTPSYTPVTWNGNVTAYSLDPTTGSQSGIAWQVETLVSTDPVTGVNTYSSIIPSASSRNIYVGNGATSGARAVAFDHTTMNNAGLTASMTGTVNAGLINYLRGDATNEDTSASSTSTTAIYRARITRLGDIVNSTPVFVKSNVDLNYDLLPSGTAGQSSYRAYVDGTGTTPIGGKKQRAEGVLFVGANDGMLHAFRDGTFNATTGAVVAPGGVEVFAYVPKAILPTINQLASKTYVHRYYVDGPNVETDAYFSGGTPRWANVVIGTTGAGAGVAASAGTSPRTAVFAIDTTSLTTSTTTMNASNVLWEVSSSDANFSELGYVLTDVQAGPTKDGSWVAIFGNGYESASCQARLYVVNLETGARIREINTNSGNCSTAKNGLSGVRVVRNANQQIIGVYAGDLQGNLWKFNLNNTNSASWGVDLGGSALFTAGSTQPITSTPAVVPLTTATRPTTGYMVVAGTGKFYEVTDITTTTAQSLYGIWDPLEFGASTIPAGTALTAKTLLVQQTIGAAQTAASGNTYFGVSTNAVDYVGTTTPSVVAPRRGWYINLPNTGQRMVYPLETIANSYLVADTISPANVSLDPCSSTTGGTGYLYYVNALTGAGPTEAIMDTDGSGIIDGADLVVAGIEGKADGRNVNLLIDSNSSRYKYVSVSGGAPGGTIVQISCALTNTCVTPGASHIKTREWRQLFMR